MPTRTIYNSTLLLIQALAMVTSGVLLFLYPNHMVKGFIFLSGFLSAAYGGISIIKFFFGEERGRIFPDLFTAVVLCGMGVLLWRGSDEAGNWLLFALSTLFLLLAVHVLIAAVDFRYQFRFWWVSIFLVLLSILTTFMIVTGQTVAGMGASVLTSIQLILMGGLTLWMGLLDKRTEAEYRKTLRELKAGNAAH